MADNNNQCTGIEAYKACWEATHGATVPIFWSSMVPAGQVSSSLGRIPVAVAVAVEVL